MPLKGCIVILLGNNIKVLSLSTDNTFHINMPAELVKADDGEWKIRGLASTASRDRQGEVLLQTGIDPTPIDEGRAFFNWDHQKGIENILGPIDSYKHTSDGLVLEGRLFKNHSKAKTVYEIMSSLGKSDIGKVGLSVEGKILERGEDGKTIKKCQINACALTLNPVNTDTYVDFAKSMSAAALSFETETPPKGEELPAGHFSPEDVSKIIKALSVGSSYADKTPSELSGGEALAQEDLDKKTKKKKLKKMSKTMYKSSMVEIINKLQELYPNNSRTELWEAFKDRLHTKFPEISEN